MTPQLPIVVCLSFCWRDIVQRFHQAVVVEPGHPFQCCQFHRFPCSPRCPTMDQFGLVQTIDGLRQGVFIAVALATYRRSDASLCQALAVPNRYVLRATDPNDGSVHLLDGARDNRGQTTVSPIKLKPIPILSEPQAAPRPPGSAERSAAHHPARQQPAGMFLRRCGLPLLSRLAARARGKNGCQIHAHVLMTNHVHLLMSAERSDAPGALMKTLGQRYVQYVHRTYRRSGTMGRAVPLMPYSGRKLLAGVPALHRIESCAGRDGGSSSRISLAELPQ